MRCLRNPLRGAFLFFVADGAFVLFLLGVEVARGGSLGDAVLSHKSIGLGLSVVFVACYLWRSIAAWWIALLFLPVMFLCYHIGKDLAPDTGSIVAFGVVYFFLVCYLAGRFGPYKEYLARRRGSVG